MIILAHRGWWRTPAEKNTLQALERAFAAEFGVETDLRDHDGELIVAHDPPCGGGHLPFEAALAAFKRAGEPGAFAINVKADGLQDQLKAAIARTKVTRAYVFDMSVPDAVRYLAAGIPAYTRASEYESTPSFLGQAAGVWVDGFMSDWAQGEHIGQFLDQGKSVALVSPECHKRSHSEAWAHWRSFGGDPRVHLCTDFPDEADRYFNSSKD
jgi:hypothetical protein